MQLQAIDLHQPQTAARRISLKSLRENGFWRSKKPPYFKKTLASGAIYSEWADPFFLISEEKKQTTFTTKAHQDGFFFRRRSETAKGHTKKDIFKEYFPIIRGDNLPTDKKKPLLTQYYAEANTLGVQSCWLGLKHIPR